MVGFGKASTKWTLFAILCSWLISSGTVSYTHLSVDSKNFSLPVETPQTNAAANDATTNVPLTYEVAGQFSKKAVVSEKALPNTGSEQSIFLSLIHIS